jgi:hypothetical protein
MFPARLNILSLGTEDKKPRLNMDWFDDVVLVATAGPKFTKAEIVENEVTRYVSEPSSTVDPLTWWSKTFDKNVNQNYVKLYYMSFTCVLFSTVMEVFM